MARKFKQGDRVYEVITYFKTGPESRETRSLNVAVRLANVMAKRGLKSVLLQIDYGSHPKELATVRPGQSADVSALLRKANPLSSTAESVLIAVGIVGAVALGYSLLTSKSASATTTAGQYTITPANSGQTLNLHVGDTIIAKLPAPASGYTWDGGGQGSTVLTYGTPVTAADGSVSNSLTATSTGTEQLAFAQYDASNNVNASTEFLVTVNVS
jgi:hypothetical protein